MEPLVLGLHSLTRWLLLAAIGWALVRGVAGWRRGTEVTDRDRRGVSVLVWLANLQLLLGLVLYVGISPWLPALRVDAKAAMKNEIVRFYAIEHPFTMLVALAIVHVAAARFRRATEARVAWRRLVIGIGIATVLVLAAIPWPFWWFGRPLVPFTSG